MEPNPFLLLSKPSVRVRVIWREWGPYRCYAKAFSENREQGAEIVTDLNRAALTAADPS